MLRDNKNKDIMHSAINFLAYRARSKAELFSKLIKKYKLDDIKSVIKELEVKGYVNDKEFAKMYSSNLIKNKLLSKKAVKHRLLKHKISEDILNPILDNIFSQLNEKQIIFKIITKKISKNENMNDKDIAKLFLYLKRKGFYLNDIKDVAREFNI